MKFTGVSLLLLLLSTVSSQANAQPIRIAAIGDSITAGLGIPNPAETYPAQLQQLLGAGFDVQNFGRSGADVLNINNGPYAGTQEHQHALAFLPDIVVSNLGINDSGLFLDNQQAFVDDYSSLLNQYANLSTSPTIYLWTELAPAFPGQANYQLIQDQRDAVNLRLSEVASALGGLGIDMHSPLDDHPEWFPDFLHPNAEGAERIAVVTHAYLTSPPWNGIAGDVNQDGVFAGDGTGTELVDDVSAFLAGWGATDLIGTFNQVTHGDLNFDGKTSLPDAFIMHDLLEAAGVAVNIGDLVSGSVVPEPATLAVLLLAASMMTVMRPQTGDMARAARLSYSPAAN